MNFEGGAHRVDAPNNQADDQGDGLSSVPSLPKGGGAIRAISDGFKANPATGTASLSVPIPASPARALTPQHALSYDSGSGNSAFGLGWQVAVPTIARRLNRGLPVFDDVLDVFTLGGEDLVTVVDEAGAAIVLRQQIDGMDWRIHRYRSRSEGSFLRVEHWRPVGGGASHWRSWTTGNIVSIYGQTAVARIADPLDGNRIAQWALEQQFDALGNVANYIYKAEDDANLTPWESARRQGSAPAGHYLKELRYGNKTPYRGQALAEDDYCFSVIFDYGEHGQEVPTRGEQLAWPLRDDPFSDYRAGFEQRKRRLCQRIVCFHNFEELGDGWVPVAGLEIGFKAPDPGFALIESLTQIAFDADGMIDRMPPMTLDYAPLIWGTVAQDVRSDGAATPSGGNGWQDLLGEGLPGRISQSSGALVFARNLGAANLGPATPLPVQPTISGLGDALSVEDPAGTGRKGLLVKQAGLSGFYEIGMDERPASFRAFASGPVGIPASAAMQVADLDGDGLSDMVMRDETGLVWYPSKGKDGFAAPVRLSVVGNAEGIVRLASDKTGAMFFADMSGDGLPDVVRIEQASLRYWSNLGRGKFAAPIMMQGVVPFDALDQFDPRRIRLADVDGSGVNDVIYIGATGAHVFMNRQGNALAAAQWIALPTGAAAKLNELAVLDLKGDGTAGLVWAQAGTQNLRFLPLTSGVKPWLLTRSQNGMGGEMVLTYRSSTSYYLEDKAAGQPWLTRLHFPVQCLAKVTRRDLITGLSYTSVSRYRHGYFDPVEREFRGFARVDRTDTETVAAGAGLARALYQPPVQTRSWFHTGADLAEGDLITGLTQEMFNHPDLCRLEKTVTGTEGLSPDDLRQAWRMLRGVALQTETYLLDDGPLAQNPVSMETPAYHLVRRQTEQPLLTGQKEGGWPVFQLLNRGSISNALDRVPEDARCAISWVLAWDDYGAPLQQLSVGLPRLMVDATLAPDVQAAQARTHITLSETTQIAADDPQAAVIPDALLGAANLRRLPVGQEAKSFEIMGANLAAGPITADVMAAVGNADASTFVNYLARDAGQGRRLLSHARSLYFDDALSGVLPVGQVGRIALPAVSQTFVFPEDVIELAFGTRVDDAILQEAGYERVQKSDGTFEDGWWISSGRPVFEADAAEHFYLPSGSLDAIGNLTTLERDAPRLAVIASRFPLLGHETRVVMDYRTLTPRATRDINLNWQVNQTDAFGRSVALAKMGKLPGIETPNGHETTGQGDTLDHPASRFEYDSHAWSRDGRPVASRETVYETHFEGSDLPRRTLETVSYSGGLGQVVLTKSRTRGGIAQQVSAPGVVQTVDTGTAPRWVGNGRTVYTNKGLPLVSFEPYFATTDGYETDPALLETGASTYQFYDGLGRSIGSIAPDQSWSKVVTTAWHSQMWDAGDTLAISDPLSDHEVGGHFAGLAPERYNQGWAGPRLSGALGPAARTAAEVSQIYGATPSVTHTDALGRGIVSISNNGDDGAFATRTELDIEGQVWRVTDPRGNDVMRYVHGPSGAGGAPLCQISADAGTTRALADFMGRPFMAWDADDVLTRHYYDAAGRPLRTDVVNNGTVRCVGRAIYGEDAVDAQARNLFGNVWKTWDSAGFNVKVEIDFKGNTLVAAQQLLDDPTLDVDWPVAESACMALLSPQVYTGSSRFDALNRPTTDIAPHIEGNAVYETRPTYAEGGGLLRMELRRGDGDFDTYIEDIVYDAKGQRQFIRYGNGAQTLYEYDPLSFRLTRMQTVRDSDSAQLQDLRYTYDIVGNITSIEDHAQQTVHFGNQVVSPHGAYRYDPLYRLIHATGREHIDQAGVPDWRSGWQAIAHPQDGTRMRNYSQTYRYDAVGNLETMSHSATAGSFTRGFEYAQTSNRLLAQTHGTVTERFDYTNGGEMTGMDHLAAMDWDFAGRLRRVDKGSAGTTWFGYGAGSGRVHKTMIRPDGRREERLYFGGIEVFRISDADGVILERETLHVTDDGGRIAMLETLVVDNRLPVVDPIGLARYQMGNNLGSAMIELDHVAAVISYEEYHPYGTTAYHGVDQTREVPAKRYRYTGKERDEETGFTFHGARYYAPWLCRWISADPIGIGDGVNVYAYVGGRPIGSVDHTGTSEIPAEQLRGARHLQTAKGAGQAKIAAEAVVAQGEARISSTATKDATKVIGNAVKESLAVINEKIQKAPTAEIANKMKKELQDPLVKSASGLAGKQAAKATTGLGVRALGARGVGFVFSGLRVLTGPMSLLLMMQPSNSGQSRASDEGIRGGGGVEPETELDAGDVESTDVDTDSTVDADIDIDTSAGYETKVRNGVEYELRPSSKNPEVSRWQLLNGERRASNRQTYIGSTPSLRDPRVRNYMINRGLADGTVKIVNGDEVEYLDHHTGDWMPLNYAQMGHIEGASVAWNDRLYRTGPRSPEVFAFQQNLENYRLETGTFNMIDGSLLAPSYRLPEQQ